MVTHLQLISSFFFRPCLDACRCPRSELGADRVSLIRAASREDRFGEVEGRFVLQRQCRLRRVMARVPQAIALLLAYASACNCDVAVFAPASTITRVPTVTRL